MAENFADKKINIHSYNVKEILKLNESVQPFVNKLLQNFFSGDIVFLSEENKKHLNEKSEVFGKTVDELVNELLETVEIAIPEKQKVKVQLFQRKVKNRIVRGDKNFVTDV